MHSRPTGGGEPALAPSWTTAPPAAASPIREDLEATTGVLSQFRAAAAAAAAAAKPAASVAALAAAAASVAALAAAEATFEADWRGGVVTGAGAVDRGAATEVVTCASVSDEARFLAPMLLLALPPMSFEAFPPLVGLLLLIPASPLTSSLVSSRSSRSIRCGRRGRSSPRWLTQCHASFAKDTTATVSGQETA